MLISFIGCPASGKTTTAAMLFAKLKELGIPTEFICEEARIHIASIRYEQKLQPTDKLTLSDKDQLEIMEAQWNSEEVLTTVCGSSVVVVTDSSPLNALLYMSRTCREFKETQDLISSCSPDIVFYLPPVAQIQAMYDKVFDPNRVHDEAASFRIDKLIPEIIETYAPEIKMIPLVGDPQQRLQQAISVVIRRLLND